MILIWHIDAIEMKLSKLTKEEENDKLITEISNISKNFLKLEEQKIEQYKKDTKKKNYKYVPSVKICINTINQIKGIADRKKEIFTLVYMLEKEILYSGGLDNNIHFYNIELGIYINSLKVTKFFKLQGHKASVTCLTYDMHFLISGSADSIINVNF